MKEEDLIAFFNQILFKLQKRDEIRLDPKRIISIDLYQLSEYELAYYIADIFRKHHSIPNEYISYYIKTLDNTVTPPKITRKGKQIIRNKFKTVGINTRTLAGGSLSKCILKKDRNKLIVVKSATGWPSKKLANEILFLGELNKNKRVSLHIPKIIHSKMTDNKATLMLKYYPCNTLSYNILFSIIDTKSAWKITNKILNFVAEDIWTIKRQKTPEKYVEAFFLDRIMSNIDKMLPQSTLFQHIIKNKNIRINGHDYLNIFEIVKQIRSDKELLKALTPPYLQTIWGDLHPNNILIDNERFLLIDPRGEPGDYLYDLGKIYHTYGPGRYDYIDNDLFSISIDNSMRIMRQFQTNHPSWNTYNQLEGLFMQTLSKYVDRSDYNWGIRWEFLKFCIFATMPLFLIKNNGVESRALMGYSNAVILGNNFLKSIKFSRS